MSSFKMENNIVSESAATAVVAFQNIEPVISAAPLPLTSVPTVTFGNVPTQTGPLGSGNYKMLVYNTITRSINWVDFKTV